MFATSLACWTLFKVVPDASTGFMFACYSIMGRMGGGDREGGNQEGRSTLHINM